MNCSVTLIAHGAAKETLLRHIPFWLSLKPTYFLVVSPVDDQVSGVDLTPTGVPVQCASIGGRGHACPGSILRLRWILERLASLNDVEQHFVSEYDAIPLASSISLKPGWIGPMQCNNNPEWYSAKTYSTSPWMADRKTVKAMSAVSCARIDITERGMADRYLAAIANAAGVLLADYDPPGFTRNTIQPEDWPEMSSRVRKGLTMIHGIKDMKTLEQIQLSLSRNGH